MATGVGVHLRIQHQQLHVRTVLQDHLGDVLETNIAHGTITTDSPDLGHLTDFLIGHQRVIKVRQFKVFAFAAHAVVTLDQRGSQTLGRHRTARVVEHGRFPDQPADGRAILEKGVHPRIRVRITWRRGAVHRVTTGVRAHVHGAHAVSHATIHGLQIAVVEGILTHHRHECIHDFLIGNLAMLREAMIGIGIILAAQAHNHVGNGAGKPFVLVLTPRLQNPEFGHSVGFQLGGFLTQTRGFLVIHRPHVCLGDRGDRTQHALLSAAGTSAIAGNERLVIAPHHEVVSQGRFAGGLGAVIIVQAEEFLVCVRQQPAEHLCGGELGVEIGSLRGHAQRIMITAHLYAFAAAFAEIAHEDGEQSAVARVLLLHAAPNSGDVVVRQRQLIDDGQEFAASHLVDGRQLIHLGPQNILKRFLGFGRHTLVHLRAATLVQPGHLI